MASAGVARAVDPVYSDVDGDVVFCLASGDGASDRFTSIQVGTLAATLTAAAIRDAVDGAPSPSGAGFMLRRPDGRHVQDRGGRPAQHPLRRGGSGAAPLQLHAGRIGAIAKGVRRPRSRFGGRLEPFFRLDLVLHEGRGELSTVTAAHTVAGHPNLRSSGPALGGGGARLRRGAAAARRRRSRTPPPTTCSAATWRCSTARSRRAGCRRSRGGRRRRPRHGARVPAQAGAGGGVRAGARLLRALRRGRGARRASPARPAA